MASNNLINIRTVNSLLIVNWNANGIKNKRSTFIAFLSRHNIDIACITETHLIKNENFKIPGFKIYRNDRNAPIASGGVAIIAKKNISLYPLSVDNYIYLEALAVKVELENNATVKLICAYQQPNKRLQQLDIDTAFNNNEPTLLMGDINSKNTIWGCRTTNPNGVKLNAYAANNAVQITAPSEPTYLPYRTDHQPDILDITLHKNFSRPIYLTVLTELDSDHLPVLHSFLSTPKNAYIPPRLINGLINWQHFQKKIDNSIKCPANLKTNNDVDNSIEYLTNAIKISVEQSTYKKFRNRPKNNQTPQHIIELIKEKNNTRRLWQRTRMPYLKAQLNQLTHRVKWELDNIRIKNYQQYISELEPGDPTMWQATKRILKQPHIISSLKVNGKTYSSDSERCEAFANHLEEVFTTPEDNDTELSGKIEENLVQYTSYITGNIDHTTPSEIKQHIKNLPLKKSPGHDLIPNIVLKYFTKKVLAYLASTFNVCLRNGYFPESWKHAEVLLFHKPNKDPHNPSSYRPISLLPTLSKLFEKIILTRLTQFLNNKNILPHLQFGFRPKHSTTHQLQRITEIIEKGYEDKCFTAIAFLDVAQAFDKVWTKGLLHKLSELNMELYLFKILRSFLINRTFCVKINGTQSTRRNINAGVPQGSILGPSLFNIFVHDIPEVQNSMLAMYADDTAVITQNLMLDEAITALQNALDIIAKYFKTWYIKLNSAKCECKIFTLRRVGNIPKIRIGNQELDWNPSNETIKYLGIHLDKRLTWGPHINKKLKECHARLSMLYPIINKRSPLKIKCALLVYQSILRPVLTYACTVWGAAHKTHIRKLQSFQCKVLRIATNASWMIRNSQIHRELGIPTIEEYISKSGKTFFHNIVQCPGGDYYKLGKRHQHKRLKRKLAQDVLLSSDSENNSLSDSDSETESVV